MDEHEYQILLDAVFDIRNRLDAIEANSRKANTEQPLVGPPEKSNGRPAALARPASLSELKTWIKKEFHLDQDRWQYADYGQGMMVAAERILQRIEKLDQGPIANSPSEESSKEPNSFIEWLISKQ